MTLSWFTTLLVGLCAAAGPIAADPFVVQQAPPSAIVSLRSPGGSHGQEHTWWARAGACSPTGAASIPGPIRTPAQDLPPDRWTAVRVPADLLKEQKFLQEGGEARGGRRFCYRKAILFPEKISAPVAVRLGTISDSDRVYLNGTLIARHGSMQAETPQAYDQIRLVPLPLEFLRPGKVNILLVDVRSYFPDEAGITRDRVEIGPAGALARELDRELLWELPLLACYGLLGACFLFLFLRRSELRESLYFALFCLGIAAYQLLRTQVKYRLGLDLLPCKRAEYIILFAFAPAWYHTVRTFFGFPGSRFGRVWDWLAHGASAVALAGGVWVALSDSVIRWNAFNHQYFQPTVWPVLILGTTGIVIHRALKGNGNAWVLCAALAVMLVALPLDVLSARGLLNIPSVLGYAFLVFVSATAAILANRFVRAQRSPRTIS